MIPYPNNQPADCAVCRIGGGVGNILESLQCSAIAAHTYGVDICFLYWRHGTPLVNQNTLDSLFDFNAVSCLNVKLISLDDLAAQELANGVSRDRVIPRLVKYLIAIKAGVVLKRTTRIEQKNYPPELLAKLWKQLRSAILVSKTADDFALDNITPATLGVHVRRTDSRVLPIVTTEKIFHLVDCQLGKDCNRIFLATDDSDEEKKFLGRYGKLVVFTNKSTNLRWNTPGRRRELVTIDTYKEALIDMLVLGGCKNIVGSCVSSFSSGAVKLSTVNSELTITS